MKRSVFFLTGGTGFLGSYLLKILLQEGHKVYVLARSKGEQSAYMRILKVLRFWDFSCTDDDLTRLKIVEGDVASPDLNITSRRVQEEMIHEVEQIIHSAALANLRAPLVLTRKVNVEGTRFILDFALQCTRNSNFKKVNHISTCYVVGDKQGIHFKEKMLPLGQNFFTNYEQSKFETELMIQKYKRRGLEISIFRPSLIMGDSLQGKTIDFRLFYQPLHFFSNEVFREFPMDLRGITNLINVDTAANAIYSLLDKPSNVYHIVSPEHTTMDFFMKIASESLKFELPKYVDVEKFDNSVWTPTQKLLAEPYIPYFNYKTQFCSLETRTVLEKNNFTFPNIDEKNLRRIFEYCLKRKFIKEKHERF